MRVVSYISRTFLRCAAALAGLLLVSAVLYPELAGQVVQHATPNLSPLYNWFATHAHAVGGAVALATTPLVTTRSLKTILAEMKTIQDAHRGKPMPEDVAAKFEALAAEAAPMQAEVDRQKAEQRREEQLGQLSDAAKFVRPASLPGSTTPLEGDMSPEAKAEQERLAQRQVAGYVRLGDLVIASEGLKAYRAAGKPSQQTILAKVGAILAGKRSGDNELLVPLTKQQIPQFKRAWDELVERKAVPDIGGSTSDVVIEPTRLADIVRVTEHDRLSIRDILDVQRTTSDAIKYTRITSYTRAAAAVANSASKPQATMALDTVTEAVRTIAVWMPVENQQLDDLPALQGMINNELLFDVAKHLEELIVYGDGTGENFNGILTNSSVLVVGDDGAGNTRIEADDTLIDIARRGITDVRRAGYEPNGIIVDPFDWEEIVLEKGSDNRYVWVVVTEAGVQRLWGVPVIETVAMSDFQVDQRHLLVGDFRRGATLFDRQDANISVGYINEQFIKNQKTILAELRAAFALKRPGAFRKYQTIAGVAS